MSILDIIIIIFIILELSNVIILYFYKDFNQGNGIAVFKQWHDNKKNENLNLFHTYLINWVAGTKLIFISLLILILILGDDLIKQWSLIILILTTATYYFKLHPIICKLDNENQLTNKNYSKTLFYMITSFIILFTIGLLINLI